MQIAQKNEKVGKIAVIIRVSHVVGHLHGVHRLTVFLLLSNHMLYLIRIGLHIFPHINTYRVIFFVFTGSTYCVCMDYFWVSTSLCTLSKVGTSPVLFFFTRYCPYPDTLDHLVDGRFIGLQKNWIFWVYI